MVTSSAIVIIFWLMSFLISERKKNKNFNVQHLEVGMKMRAEVGETSGCSTHQGQFNNIHWTGISHASNISSPC